MHFQRSSSQEPESSLVILHRMRDPASACHGGTSMNTFCAERRLAVVSRRFRFCIQLTSLLSTLPVWAMLALGLTPATARAAAPMIEVLSNRADLISGGNALVQINL